LEMLRSMIQYYNRTQGGIPTRCRITRYLPIIKSEILLGIGIRSPC
jgi:hypothetical protein